MSPARLVEELPIGYSWWLIFVWRAGEEEEQIAVWRGEIMLELGGG